jgi:hypothetical protein
MVAQINTVLLYFKPLCTGRCWNSPPPEVNINKIKFILHEIVVKIY